MKVLAVTETWLTELTANAISIPGYKFIHKNREEGRGGGVGFFVKDENDFHRHDINAPMLLLRHMKVYS